MNLKDKVKELAQKYSNEVLSDRRYLHAHPELSFQEHNTAKFVANKLKSIGLTPIENIAGTGITALIEGKKPESKTVALRADMDALPIVEQNDVPYKSTNEGVMHACGHDVHTSSLLGTARILNDLRGHFEGTFKLIFQPGEEMSPGGASLMIKENVLKANLNKAAPRSIYAQHVAPFIEVGKVGFKPGPVLASCDDIYITVKGAGGHAGTPHEVVDTILIASQIVVSLQQIVSRNIPPHIPAVLSFGKIVGEGSTNIIPAEVKIEGTFRTFDEEWRKKAHENIVRLAKATAQGMGGDCEIEIEIGYPYLNNAIDFTERSMVYAQEFLGKDKVELLPNVIMGSEDFAFYSHHIDACFYTLGVKNEAKNITDGLHTPRFDIDEGAVEIGVGLMTWMGLCELKQL
ncbi:M20 family metallopeptidase [uncultured Microscilla sp.]|uniref:M20 metallopeptidase family protein n=1 Tax=uncultured Microscilla sp. TaxID=432653 RepID=UPI002609D2B1|nr:amidohydrolase [uncultured Microscilla sp.]